MPKRKGPTLTAPDVWRHHPPESMERSTYALAALSVQLQHDPETWAVQDAVHECVVHEHIAASEASFQRGKAHGAWLKAEEIRREVKTAEEVEKLQSNLYDLQTRYAVLNGKYQEALRMLRTH